MSAWSSWINSPYVGICVRPRATIRSVVDRDPRDKVIALVLVHSLVVPVWTVIHPHGPPTPVAYRIGGQLIHVTIPYIFYLVISPITAFVFLYVSGALIRWTGSLLGGTAKAVEVRAALAWPAVFSIITAPVPLLCGDPASAVSWRGWYFPPTVPIHWRWMLPGIVVATLRWLWHFVISVECVAEVHRFPGWRGLAATISGFIALVVLLAILYALLAVPARLLR